MQKYLNARLVMERYSIARSTIWDWVQKGKLPPPIKIHGVTRWLVDELEEWDKSKTQEHEMTSNLFKTDNKD